MAAANLTIYSESTDFALGGLNGDRMGVTVGECPIVEKGQAGLYEPTWLEGEFVFITKSDLILISFDGSTWFKLLDRQTGWQYRLFNLSGRFQLIVNKIDGGDSNETQPSYFISKIKDNPNGFTFAEFQA